MMLGDMPIEENLDERKPLPSLPSALPVQPEEK